MKKNLFLSSTAIAAAALTAFFCYKSFTPQLSEADILLNENIEALTNEENNGNFHYPEAKGKALFCKLYVYMKGGIIVSTGTTENPQYEGKAEYEKIMKEGLKDRCPDKGNGCNPFSCQEVAYIK